MAHIPHLLLAGPWIADEIALPRQKAHHLERVLRLDPGSEVTYTDGRGTVGAGRFRPASVLRGSESKLEAPPVSLTLAVAPPHERDRVRFLVEKLAELEVSRLLWLQTRFGAGRPPESARAAAWAIAALEQSRGAWLMEVDPKWVGPGALRAGAFFADLGGDDLPPEGAGEIVVAIGPEGGWAAGEIPDGARRLGLGRTVLRVETAAVASAVLCRFGKRANPGCDPATLRGSLPPG
ncbi:MAG TPA: 16S rRNA (uracil(1498)-N(3))-methyltransferase [Acidimicrobiia bacterium]|nr:16S rRNA (uracil(1498)-N(3))-methyltransferase [Acidimicrobiia bacterium]